MFLGNPCIFCLEGIFLRRRSLLKSIHLFLTGPKPPLRVKVMKGIQFIRITIQIWITIKPPLVYMAACRRNNILIALTGTPSVCPHIIVWFAHVGTSILKAFTGRPGLCPHRRVGIKPVAYRARTPIFHGVVVTLALRTSPGKVVFRLDTIEFLNLMRYFCLLLTKHKFIKKSHVIFLKLRV